MNYFKEKEFFCPCGCGLDFEDMDEDVVDDLDRARHYAEVPFKINSSIRCAKQNKKSGGAKTSSHLKGLAVDIDTPSSFIRYRVLSGLRQAGFTRIGIGPDFIHADKDEDKPKELMWVY